MVCLNFLRLKSSVIAQKNTLVRRRDPSSISQLSLLSQPNVSSVRKGVLKTLALNQVRERLPGSIVILMTRPGGLL